MFPSSGYFKGLNCPYFQSGLCERPYCHFRHVKSDKDATTSSAIPQISSSGRKTFTPAEGNVISTPAGPTGSKIFLSERKNSLDSGQYTDIIAQASDGNDVYDLPSDLSTASEPTYDPTPKTLVDNVKSVHYHEEYDPLGSSPYEADSLPLYEPGSFSDKSRTSPTSQESVTDKPGYDPENIPAYAPSTIPEYNPTPINKLKKVKTKHGTDLEYDPVSNFAFSSKAGSNDITEVQYVPMKRQRLDDFPSADVDDMNVDDFGDSDSARFSDSDALSEKSLVVESDSKEKCDNAADLYSVKTCYKDTLTGNENTKRKSEKSHNCLNNEKRSSSKTEQNVKSAKHVKSQKVNRSDSQNKERTNLTSDKDSVHRKDKNVTNKITDKKGKHKSDCDKEKTIKKERDSVKKENTSENSSLKSSSKTFSSSSSSKSPSKHSLTSSAKSSSKSVSSKSASQHSAKHTSSQSKSERKDTSPHPESKHLNSKDKSSSKQQDHNKHGTSNSQNVKKSVSKHHSKSEKENVKNGKSRSEEANGNGSKTKHSLESSQKSAGSQGDCKLVKKTLCVDLFGQDSEYSDLSDLEDSNPLSSQDKSSEMSEDQLKHFLEDSDYECDGDTYDECLRIFNEGIAVSTQSNNDERKKYREQSSTNLVPSVQIKKRVAHQGAEKAERKFVEKARKKMSPGEVMHNRIVAMQKKAMEAERLKKAESEAISNAIASNSVLFKNQQNRFAHKAKVFDQLSREKEQGRTSAITVVKGEKRKAHTPTLSNAKRPTIPADFGSKVPSNIRQRYLNLIIDECLKLCKTEDEAYAKAQDEEKAVYERATNKNIYLRVAVNAIKRLRTEIQQRDGSPTKVYCGKQSHKATLDGRKATTTNYTVNQSGKQAFVQTSDFKGAELYKRLQKYVLTEDQLKQNGFPLPDPEAGGCCKFYVDPPNKDVSLKQHEKNCCRCGKRFTVFPNGKYNSKEECIFHWGKAWKKKVAGSWDVRYTCCGGDLDSEGCSICKLHVNETNKYMNLSGYMKTIPSSPPIDGDYGVYAMDCEMVYTTIGMELARVTVTDADMKSVYETFVKPDYPVIDYNTRFSGITEEQMKGVQTCLRDVQAVLLSLFTAQTILLGHSLESDLIAVKLLHKVVVDTSVVFPHRLGPPYKRALRNLMADHLQKIIQDDIGGHDSREDALACMELMQWKLKEDAKKEIRHS